MIRAAASYALQPAGLPVPDAEAAAHSGRVAAALREAVAAAGGSLGFDEFMHLVLNAPGLGYYRAGQTRFGRSGDFVTAPELTPVFARCLARPVGELLRRLGPPARILEAGAGSGALAAELLPALGTVAAGYDILEPSADLRAAQASRLAGADIPVRWLDAWPERGWRGVVIANEVLDTLPVVRFRKREDGTLEELRVAAQASGFCWMPAPPRPALAAAVDEIERQLDAPLPPGYVSEVCLVLEAWLAALAEPLADAAVILVDYGCTRREYYHPQRSGGTLICHYRHRAHDDPFVLPGIQDVSCWVDFSAVAAAAVAAGFEVAGFTTQAHFLLGAGLDEVLAAHAGEAPERDAARAAAVRRLVLPGEMGEAFKVMVLAKGVRARDLPALGVADHLPRL